MLLKRIYLFGIALLVLLITACSSETEAGKDPSEQKKEFEAATDLEGMLKEEPGKYAGDKYDQAKVKKELDNLPNNMTGKKAYNHLVQLLAEDYKPNLKKLEKYDHSIRVDSSGPDSKMKKLPKGKALNVAILLDSSGSMAGKVDGGVKMDLAKQAIKDFARKLPKNANVSLRVYGHKGPNNQADKAESCKSTEEVYPMSPYKPDAFEKSLNKFEPTGWTPLAASIQDAKRDFLRSTSDQQGEAQNIIYVVSDGVETCDGDPVAAAEQLNQSKIKAIVNIIGFDVNNAGQRALEQVAEAGDGKYATVKTKKELEEHLQKERERLIDEWED